MFIVRFETTDILMVFILKCLCLPILWSEIINSLGIMGNTNDVTHSSVTRKSFGESHASHSAMATLQNGVGGEPSLKKVSTNKAGLLLGIREPSESAKCGRPFDDDKYLKFSRFRCTQAC